MQTLLLTGWTGYIGSHAAVVFLDAGYDVIILDNLSNSDASTIDKIETITWKRPKFYDADIRNKSEIEQVFTENTIDGVVHFAGLKSVGESYEKPFEYYENNVIGSKNLFEVMEKYGVKNIIFSSSATVYNPSEKPPFTEATPTWNTSNPYGTTKFIIENILRDLAHHTWFRVMNLRYFNPIWAHESGLIGEDPNDIPNNLLPYIMKVASGELPELQVFWDDYDTVDGTGVRDYIHVVDLADAHLKAWQYLQKSPYSLLSSSPLLRVTERDLDSETSSGWLFEVFNLGTGSGTSVFKMIEITENIIWNPLPHKIAPRRDWDIATAYCSPEKARDVLDWEAKKSVKEAVSDSWNFIRKQKK